jgi:glycyl-tRNA synthetase
MVKDEKTGEAFRVDKLIEDHIEKKLEKPKKLKPEQIARYKEIFGNLGNINTGPEFDELVKELNIKNPNAKKNVLSNAYEFNLMFSTQVGPSGNCKAYLRPETAQSIFTNFKRLLEFNNGKLPFGTSIIGNAYRNEIAPRNGLLRVREFEMAEIEYFVDPLNKHCEKFNLVEDLEVRIFPRGLQTEAKDPVMMKLKDAIDQKIIANTYLGYFIGRTWLFAKLVGVHPECLRFRQHLSGEMAHYACDCWDLEILTSYGWVECVGIADRSAYDLNAHMESSGDKLFASRKLDKPRVYQVIETQLNKGLMGKTFKRDNSEVLKLIGALSNEELKVLKSEIESKGTYSLNGKFELTKEMFKSIKEVTKTEQSEKYTPNVIEPSFGLGRIVYAILEQSFSFRENDKQRCFFSFKPMLAPFKVVILPLTSSKDMVDKVKCIETLLRKNGISCKKDVGSTTIGKKYARTDEMGIPLGVTVDSETLKDETVTLRDTLSMVQVRLPIAELVGVVNQFLTNPDYTFEDVKKKYPVFN